MLVLLPLATPPPPTAKPPPPRIEIMIELGAGIAVPPGPRYSVYSDGTPSYFGVSIESLLIAGRVGAILWAQDRRHAIVPELELAGGPLTLNPYYPQYQERNLNRLRALAGARLLFPFGRFTIHPRLMLGVDYLWGSYAAGFMPPGTGIGQLNTSIGFAVEPGFGFRWNPTRHFSIGADVAVPLAFGHKLFSGPSVDFTFLGVVALRFY